MTRSTRNLRARGQDRHPPRAFVLAVLVLASLLGSGGSALALEPDKALSQYPHRDWQTTDGLPQNSILALAQTPDGYLWGGTWEGLVRFDGVRFTVFDKNNTPALPGRTIRGLTVDREGTLWIAHEEGLTGMREGRFFPAPVPAGTVLRDVRHLLAARDGSLWFGVHGKGLRRLSGGQLRSWTKAEGLAHDTVSKLAEDATGGLWLSTRAGVQRWDGEGWGALLPFEGPHAVVHGLVFDSEGTLWVATDDGYVYRLQDGVLRRAPEASLPGSAATILHVDRQGSLWVGSMGNGLLRLARGQRSVLEASQGLLSNMITAVLEDSRGNLWVGTEGGGLHRLKDAPFTPYGPPEGLADKMVAGILETRDGSLWFATLGGGVTRWHDGRMTSWSTRDGLAHDRVRTLAEGRDGVVWFGTQRGISRWHEGTLTTLGPAQGLPESSVRVVHEDPQGTLWAGTRSGLARWNGKSFETLTQSDGLPGRDITLLQDSAAGGLWVGTRGGGLAHLLDGRILLVSPEDEPMNSELQTIHEDGTGALWIGTDEGLFRWKEGRFMRFSTAHGLFDDRVFAILPDANGSFWMSCNKGIFRVARAELEAVAEGRLERVTSRVYGTEDGMRSEECNGSGSPAGWKSRDGRLWFPTIRGAVVHDPNRQETPPPPPPVLIEEVRVDGRAVPAAERDGVSAGVGQVEFHYTALGLHAPQRLSFRYQLEGVDKDWVQAGQRRVAYYTHLPPGPYRFRVEASDLESGNATRSAEATLYLRPRFHQTLLFRVSGGLSLVLLLVGGVWLRLRQLRQRERELQARVEERTAELASVNADLKAHLQELQDTRERLVHSEKMAAIGTLAAGVGHEINNPLAFIISNLRFVSGELRAEVARDAQPERWTESQQALDEALQGADRVRRIVADLRTFSRSTPEQRGRVELHRVLDQALSFADGVVRHRTRVVKEYGLPPTVLADERRLGQVFLNLIVNAAQALPEGRGPHNEIRLTTGQDAQGLAFISVSDNGTGIPPEVLPRIFEPFFTTKEVGEGTGLGLSICHSIIQELGGDIRVRSEPGQGTTFEVRLPPAPEDEEEAEVADAKPTPAPSRRGRLLIIDDEPLVVATLVRTLAREHDVLSFTSARQALERLRAGEPCELILCDLMMPELTGMELHATLARENPALAERMLFLTGGAFTEATRAFLASTRQPCVQKPFEPEALRARVNELLSTLTRHVA
ncbi:two-component regulator propeller domain-containing protein [Archangium sp.]|uniref:two-component regulator propeller domain-containing protein n=1 Tax=Archangium sp. TaxID=1872627 RepID=UPI00286C2156|nr:two-component regulator propeller domain-containing protein [Archangium sp.]